MTSTPHLLRPHMAIRIDALPPAADPEPRFYWCPDGCGYLTGTELRNSAIVHQVPDPDAALAEHYGLGSMLIAGTGTSVTPTTESPAA